MDRLRLLYELVNKYALRQDYSAEFAELLSPNFLDGIPKSISLNLVLQIVDLQQFNIEVFNIDRDEHFDTTEEVRAFLINDKFDFNADYLDFIKTYTQRGYFINFEINNELSTQNPAIGLMTRFGYGAAN